MSVRSDILEDVCERSLPAVVEKLRAEEHTTRNLIDVLLESGATPADVLKACLDVTGLEAAPIEWLRAPSAEAAKGFDVELCIKHSAVPVAIVAGRVCVAYCNPESGARAGMHGFPPHKAYLAMPAQLSKALAGLGGDTGQAAAVAAASARIVDADLPAPLTASRPATPRVSSKEGDAAKSGAQPRASRTEVERRRDPARTGVGRRTGERAAPAREPGAIRSVFAYMADHLVRVALVVIVIGALVFVGARELNESSRQEQLVASSRRELNTAQALALLDRAIAIDADSASAPAAFYERAKRRFGAGQIKDAQDDVTALAARADTPEAQAHLYELERLLIAGPAAAAAAAALKDAPKDAPKEAPKP